MYTCISCKDGHDGHAILFFYFNLTTGPSTHTHANTILIELGTRSTA